MDIQAEKVQVMSAMFDTPFGLIEIDSDLCIYVICHTWKLTYFLEYNALFAPTWESGEEFAVRRCFFQISQ